MTARNPASASGELTNSKSPQILVKNATPPPPQAAESTDNITKSRNGELHHGVAEPELVAIPCRSIAINSSTSGCGRNH